MKTTSVLRGVIINVFSAEPLTVTAVFASQQDIVMARPIRCDNECEDVTITIREDFDHAKDFLVAVTRSGEDGKDCHYTLLAGKAPDWIVRPEDEHFNPLGGSDSMGSESRRLVALPLAFLTRRLAAEKPKVKAAE